MVIDDILIDVTDVLAALAVGAASIVATCQVTSIWQQVNK